VGTTLLPGGGYSTPDGRTPKTHPGEQQGVGQLNTTTGDGTPHGTAHSKITGRHHPRAGGHNAVIPGLRHTSHARKRSHCAPAHKGQRQRRSDNQQQETTSGEIGPHTGETYKTRKTSPQRVCKRKEKNLREQNSGHTITQSGHEKRHDTTPTDIQTPRRMTRKRDRARRSEPAHENLTSRAVKLWTKTRQGRTQQHRRRHGEVLKNEKSADTTLRGKQESGTRQAWQSGTDRSRMNDYVKQRQTENSH